MENRWVGVEVKRAYVALRGRHNGPMGDGNVLYLSRINVSFSAGTL